MFQIIKEDCPKGWAYVRDYMGNKVFYGPEEECKQFIYMIENNVREGRTDVSDMYKYMV